MKLFLSDYLTCLRDGIYVMRQKFSKEWMTGLAIMISAAVFPVGAEESAEQPKGTLKQVPSHENVIYGPAERHRLDIWLVDSGKPTPLVIFIHGGGWNGGDKSQIPQRFLKAMLARGVSVASINYRFTSTARLPGPLHDAALAVQFLRSKSTDWSLNSNRFGAMGVSAGGCSALWLAYHDDLADPKSGDSILRLSSRLAAVVAISAQTSLEPALIRGWIGDEVLNHGMIRRAVGVRTVAELFDRADEFKDVFYDCSPINHVTTDDPPVMLTYPTLKALPAVNTGEAIHHAIFGVKLQEKCGVAGARMTLRIDDKASKDSPTAESFLADYLNAP